MLNDERVVNDGVGQPGHARAGNRKPEVALVQVRQRASRDWQ